MTGTFEGVGGLFLLCNARTSYDLGFGSGRAGLHPTLTSTLGQTFNPFIKADAAPKPDFDG